MRKTTQVFSVRCNILAGLAGAAILWLATPAAAVDFSSTALESVFVRTNQAPTNISEGTLLSPLPNATVGNFIVGSGDSDLFTLHFSGQAELRNASSSSAGFNNDDVFDLQAQAVNAATGAIIIMSPTGVTGFAGGNNPEAHSMSWAIRLQTGSWRFRVMGRLLDRTPFNAVSALLSNWTTTITRYN